MEEVSDSSKFEGSFSLLDARGVRVLTPSGLVFGRVSGIQSNGNASKILGVVVKRGFNEVYVGREYFSQMTRESFILNEEPSILMRDMAVISGHGERVGRVVQVVRVKNTNQIDSLVVKGWLRQEFTVKRSQIDSIGKSIILKEGVDVPKKSFWR